EKKDKPDKEEGKGDAESKPDKPDKGDKPDKEDKEEGKEDEDPKRVKCYKCDASIANCNDFKEEGIANCTGVYCLRRTGGEQGSDNVTRSCGVDVKPYDGCKTQNDIESCYCDTNFCNSAATSHVNTTAMTALFILLSALKNSMV
ncbi:hypothetical protein CAPTEDRAFT_215759, partial [Capitella teleta]